MFNHKQGRTFSAKAADDALTLEMYDVIGADFFGNGITSANVSDSINAAGEFSSINVRINSVGGDLFEGVAIFNLLRAAGKPVSVFVDGLAASAASLIAMAGDSITMGDGTQMMIHRAMGGALGYADDLRKLADVLDSVTDSAADIYVNRTGTKKDKVLELMNAETWMSASDAVEAGFATAVTSNGKVKNAAELFDLSMFKNTPAQLKTDTKRVESEEVNQPTDEADPLINILRKRLELLKR